MRAVGYLPRLLPRGAGGPDPARYAGDSIRRLRFQPLEPLQGWTDIVAAGMDPRA